MRQFYRIFPIRYTLSSDDDYDSLAGRHSVPSLRIGGGREDAAQISQRGQPSRLSQDGRFRATVLNAGIESGEARGNRRKCPNPRNVACETTNSKPGYASVLSVDTRT